MATTSKKSAPKKTTKTKPTPKAKAKGTGKVAPAPVAKKSARKRVDPRQPELFDMFQLSHPQPAQIEVTLRVPSGTPITIGDARQMAPAPALIPPVKPHPGLKELSRMSKEDLRTAVQNAGLNASEIIVLTSALHGCLYRLAAIGGKVTTSKKK
jgi:hypothetical protein